MTETHVIFLTLFCLSILGALIGWPDSPLLLLRGAVTGTACAGVALYAVGGLSELFAYTVALFCGMNATVFEPLLIDLFSRKLRVL